MEQQQSAPPQQQQRSRKQNASEGIATNNSPLSCHVVGRGTSGGTVVVDVFLLFRLVGANNVNIVMIMDLCQIKCMHQMLTHCWQRK